MPPSSTTHSSEKHRMSIALQVCINAGATSKKLTEFLHLKPLPSDKLFQIKEIFTRITGFQATDQALQTYNGKLLADDNNTLSECGILSGDTLVVVLKDAGTQSVSMRCLRADFENAVASTTATSQTLDSFHITHANAVAFDQMLAELPTCIKDYMTAWNQQRQLPQHPSHLVFKDRHGVQTTILHNVLDLLELKKGDQGRYQVEVRLNHLDVSDSHHAESESRYLMRDGRGYATLVGVPLNLQFDRNVWYTITGDANVITTGCFAGTLRFVSAERDTRDIGLAGRNKGKLELVEFDKHLCQTCGADHDEELCEEVDPRVLECYDCGEVGHLWHTCPYAVAPSGARPSHFNPELDLAKWTEFVGIGHGLLKEEDNIFLGDQKSDSHRRGRG
ncbi:hypothetical protein BJ508DRAFT_14083 [Ascobolus immersus RN42]|uniref:CCHC-type domain-containing protein n=1 Tax=Ascobolus immersus RN42 TaxID=1160509 RepID=A0A3N4IGC5_ASCIM|nr:hypothetical protein BJ508DRAFT_14083 [Ascobolus immersus RN42]